MNRLKKFGLVYLATVYRNFPRGREMAFIEAAKITAKLAEAGVNVFCPIAHGHPMTKFGGIDGADHEFWMWFDRPFMARSDALIVAHMEGWENSAGIADEMTFFRSAGRPIFNLDPETMAVSE